MLQVKLAADCAGRVNLTDERGRRCRQDGLSAAKPVDNLST